MGKKLFKVFGCLVLECEKGSSLTREFGVFCLDEGGSCCWRKSGEAATTARDRWGRRMSLSVRGSFVWLVGWCGCVCLFFFAWWVCVCVGVLVSSFFFLSFIIMCSLFFILGSALYLQYPCLPAHPIPSYLYCFSSLSTLLLFTLSILPMCIPFTLSILCSNVPLLFHVNPLSYHSHLLPILSILSILFVLSILLISSLHWSVHIACCCWISFLGCHPTAPGRMR